MDYDNHHKKLLLFDDCIQASKLSMVQLLSAWLTSGKTDKLSTMSPNMPHDVERHYRKATFAD